MWRIFLTLTVAFSLAGISVAEPPTSTPRLLTGEPELTWLRLKIDSLPDREPARLLIAHDGNITRRVMVDNLGVASTFITSSNVERNQLNVELLIGHAGLRINREMVPPLSTRMPLRLELSINGGKVAGTFQGRWRKNSKSLESVEVRGKVTGTVVDPAKNAVSVDAAWPSYLGPHQNFSSGDFAGEIVDDLNQAKLVWVSEYIGPTEAGSHRYGACVGVPSAAGGASPLVAHGRVFQFRYQAAGTAYQKPHLDRVLNGNQAEGTRQKMQAAGWTMDDLIARWRILADEELLCLDAATGRTLWKVRWPEEGLHYFDHKCSLTNWSGVVGGDSVVVLGGTGRLRCVDAHSGRQRWAIEVPGLAGQLQEMKQKALETKHFAAPSRQFCHALAVVDDLILAPDGYGHCGIVAIELKTGNVRWHVKDKLLPAQTASPLVVPVEDMKLVLAVGDGLVTAIDVATGETAWTSDAVGWNACQCVLAGDRLIAQAMKRADLEKEYQEYPKEKVGEWAPDAVLSAPATDHGRIGCWRVTKSGLNHLWTTPAEWGAAKYTPVGTVLGDRLCFRGKFAYQIVNLADGQRIAKSYLSAPARMDEGHMLAVPGMFIPHPDTQHGDNKFYTFPNQPNAKVGPQWRPPHPRATTYQVAMSHAWADGRLFIRGVDALYCYDLRKPDSSIDVKDE